MEIIEKREVVESPEYKNARELFISEFNSMYAATDYILSTQSVITPNNDTHIIVNIALIKSGAEWKYVADEISCDFTPEDTKALLRDMVSRLNG